MRSCHQVFMKKRKCDDDDDGGFLVFEIRQVTSHFEQNMGTECGQILSRLGKNGIQSAKLHCPNLDGGVIK